MTFQAIAEPDRFMGLDTLVCLVYNEQAPARNRELITLNSRVKPSGPFMSYAVERLHLFDDGKNYFQPRLKRKL